MGAYVNPTYPYRAPTDLQAVPVQRRPLIIVGAGPVGLAAAIDARLHGLDVLVFDEDKTVSTGSRAVCYAKRALEILDRLGVGDAACAKGVSWNVGRTFMQEEEVYQFNLVPSAGHKRPGMINLQQYYLEEMLVQRALDLGADIRWQYKVASVQPQEDGALLRVETPDGVFDIEADWLIVADGARSPIRKQLGLDIEGRIFKDRFLIADVVMKADFPAERWFWFDPPFHPGQSVLLHKQSDNVWRIDFQLGWDANPEEETKPEKVIPRIRTMLGDHRPFELQWVSIYTFQCRRMKDFRHGRLLFVGDAAHQVSPFGARGANSGFQDADDLMWKLALVMKGKAPQRLLDSYGEDRVYAADENLMNSTRSTDFITPKSRISKIFRNAVLDLAREHPFARKLVNSGRLSVPSFLTQSALNTPDRDQFVGNMVPGAPADDAPVRALLPSLRASARPPVGVVADGAKTPAQHSPAQHNPTQHSPNQHSENQHHGVQLQDAWLLDLLGQQFCLLFFVDDVLSLDSGILNELRSLSNLDIAVSACLVTGRYTQVEGIAVIEDHQGLLSQRYDGRPGSTYLVRPDQHIAARWRVFDPKVVQRALQHATANA